MKFSLAVKDFESAKEKLGSSYDPDSEFCIYEEGMPVPEGKFLIVLGDKPLDVPNVICYIPSVEDALRGVKVFSDFPEEEPAPVPGRDIPEEKVVEIDVGEIELEEVAPVKPEPKEEKAEQGKKEQKPVVEAKEDNAAEEEPAPAPPEKEDAIYVEDKETAITVAVSIHKVLPFRLVQIVDAELAEEYGVIDFNLACVEQPTEGAIIVKIDKARSCGLERYRGKELEEYENIARAALRCIGKMP